MDESAACSQWRTGSSKYIRMQYEFLSIEESGNGTDYILALMQKPNWLERMLGKKHERVAFYGHNDIWHPLYGLPLKTRAQRQLSEFFRANRSSAKSRNIPDYVAQVASSI